MKKVVLLCAALAFMIGMTAKPHYTIIKKDETGQHVVKIQAPPDGDLDRVCLLYNTGVEINCYPAQPNEIIVRTENLLVGYVVYAVAYDQAGNVSVHSNLGYVAK